MIFLSCSAVLLSCALLRRAPCSSLRAPSPRSAPCVRMFTLYRGAGGTGGGININDPDFAQSTHNPYELGPESTERVAGAPEGSVRSGRTAEPFPGCEYDVERDWWLYVPAQYDEATPANLMVCFDGGGCASRASASHVAAADDELRRRRLG